ncbi:MAG: type II secretion system ATPase GspE [Phycisphaerae bacterium]|nr:type II secretion system ATPase GspE [Phycisphaerae bacterium]
MIDKNSTDRWLLNNINSNSKATNDLCDLWQPEQQSETAVISFEQRLCRDATVSDEQLTEAQTILEKMPRKKLGEILLEMGAVTEVDLLKCLAQQYSLPFVKLEESMVDSEAFGLLDKAFIENHNVLPYKLDDGKLVVAMSDPANIFLQDEIKRKTGLFLVIHVCSPEDIKNIIKDEDDEDTSIDYQVDDIIQDVDDQDVELVETEQEDISDLERQAGDSPIIKFVNYLIMQAVKEKASDIHIEPGDKKLVVRDRIDGVLFTMLTPPHNMHPAIVSRIKIMANLDIAERRLPQDGRIRVMMNGGNVDMRVSTLPTCHGEKVVIRILDGAGSSLGLHNIGMEEDTLAILNHQIHQPHGIILVTGPTGSGKSTTLYSALRTLDLQKMNVSTVEDPVEFQVPGITQVQVHDKIGMTFGAALRSLLRQDPDVIMVGEIRDGETAKIAVQASLTGHLVLSTLHTNDAPSSITRLVNIGVEPFLVAASINAILAQRLARRICQKCKENFEPEPEHAAFLSMYGFSSANLFKGKGCPACRHTGYAGRVGLYELMSLDDSYRDIVTKNPTVSELRRVCQERGMVTLRDDGFRKVQAGLTTVEEVMRVTESTV